MVEGKKADDDRTLTSSEASENRRRRKRHHGRRTRPSRLGTLASFFELSDRLLAEIEAATFERGYEAGEFLMRQGDEGDCLVFVQDGEVEVRVSLEGEPHVLKRTGRGEVFGEMALLTSERRTADVVALTPVLALVLPAEEFHRLARNEPALAEVLSRLTARRLGRERLDALSGKVFKGYVIRRRLGRGGMAVVYEAVESSCGRRVALKMMSHRLVFDEDARRRFQAEADLIESFDHVNIARMFGRFEAFHTFFIVMEYCDGFSLDRVLAERGRLGVDDVRRVVGQLASALAYAHRHRVVHRDIKPSNVMLNRDGVVKLMDFGLALTLSEQSGGGSAVAGTPPYMAPEQLEGSPPGTAADVYTLAGLAWEMLTGASLFDADDFETLRSAHRAWQVPDITALRPEVRGDLREFLARCLVANPAKRCADLETLASWAGPVALGDLGSE